MAAALGRSRAYHVLPYHWRAYLGRVWSFFLGSTTFSFHAEVSGTGFQLHGPYQYIAIDYYHTYLKYGAYEPAVTTHITQVLRQCPAPRVLDVGAHYGWYTIYLGKLLADRGIVFAFEPSEDLFLVLKRNVELNALENIRLYKLPLSDRREKVRMVSSKITPRELRFMHSMGEQEVINEFNTTLNALTFDEINDREAIHPNIVKIDVHGVWRKVIDGMRQSLYRDIEHLYLELDTASGDIASQSADVEHVIGTIRNAGMNVYEIQHFTKRSYVELIKADEDRIASRTGDVMLYAVKMK
jgi:FkbM family methyltransferase